MPEKRLPDDGGPAFPVPMIPIDSHGGQTEVRCEGMALRLWLAGQALSNPAICNELSPVDRQAEWCLEFADAVIAKSQRVTE